MKLITTCPVCQATNKPKEEDMFMAFLGPDKTPIKLAKLPPGHLVEFIVGDENVYKLTCSQRHNFYYIYPEEKFELLFKSGISAFYDGYYREAVTSVAASVERFYEFAIKVICESQGIDPSNLGNAWKLVKNQSERQLGAFIYLYLITIKTSPPSLSNSKIEFRNEVVHKGKFPTEEATLNYISDALGLIYQILEVLNRSLNHFISTVYSRQTDGLADEYRKKKGVYVQTSKILSIVKSVTDKLPAVTIDSMLGNVEFDRNRSKELQDSLLNNNTES